MSGISKMVGLWRQPKASFPSNVLLTFFRHSSSKAKRTYKFTNDNDGSKKLSFGDYAMLVFPATTLCLGIWQTKRRTWKLDLVAELEKQTQLDPVPLPDNLSELSSMEYRKVRVRGSFDHSKEMFIGPRSFISNDSHDSGGGLFGNPNTVGWHVITPFILEGTNKSILVNRGWIPKNNKNPDLRLAGQIEGTIELVGVVRKGDTRKQFTPKNTDPDGILWSYKDIPGMAAKSGCMEVFIDADKNSTIQNGPIGGQTIVSLRNEHLSYMFTWFSLTGAMLYLWWRRFLR